MKADEFKCQHCGGVFVKGWSDEEAEAEFAEQFPHRQDEPRGAVCDDCYNMFVGYRTAERSET